MIFFGLVMKNFSDETMWKLKQINFDTKHNIFKEMRFSPKRFDWWIWPMEENGNLSDQPGKICGTELPKVLQQEWGIALYGGFLIWLTCYTISLGAKSGFSPDSLCRTNSLGNYLIRLQRSLIGKRYLEWPNHVQLAVNGEDTIGMSRPGRSTTKPRR